MDSKSILRADFVMLRLSLWSGPVYMFLGLLGFAVFAGFWPPPGAYLTAEQIGAYFVEHNTGLRTGLVLMAMCGPFYYVWSAVLSKIIQRIEGPMGVLSTVELLGGLLTGIVTFVPATIWLTAAFRPETRSAEEVQMLYDLGWIFFDVTFICSVLQNVALGLAIHRDQRSTPLFPSWIGWLCYLVAATYLPLALMPFFYEGPFAWQGLISFWVVFVMFFVLMIVVTPAAFSALRKLEVEMAAP